VSGHLHTLTVSPAGKKQPVITEQEAGWVPQTVWMLQRSEKSLTPAWSQNKILQLSSL